MTDSRRPRRPSFLQPAALDALGEPSDPIAALHAAHETAAVLVGTGRASDDPDTVARLVALTDDIGLATLADLWSARPARTLPGALWRLYLLREWVRTDADGAAREYAAGIRFTEPNHAVAGVEPPGPQEVRRVADEILRGVFSGDFGVALERAAAFCQVVASGRADVTEGARAVVQAGRLQELAADLSASARLWRSGELQ
ncbi:MAG TPA: hypothetical protein PLE12_03480 [Propionicimonas sp.]|jgi:hypothetical protein|nr:hypothetical protein [Propionicimonas sp.]